MLINLPTEVLSIIYKFIDYPDAVLFSKSSIKIKNLFDILNKNTKHTTIKSFLDIPIINENIINNNRFIKISNSIYKIVNIRNNNVFSIFCYEGIWIEIYFNSELNSTQITLHDQNNKSYIIFNFNIINYCKFNYKCKFIKNLQIIAKFCENAADC